MDALASSTELWPWTLYCTHGTERGEGAESRHHGTRAFPAHILTSSAEVGQVSQAPDTLDSACVWSRSGFTHEPRAQAGPGTESRS